MKIALRKVLKFIFQLKRYFVGKLIESTQFTRHLIGPTRFTFNQSCLSFDESKVDLRSETGVDDVEMSEWFMKFERKSRKFLRRSRGSSGKFSRAGGWVSQESHLVIMYCVLRLINPKYLSGLTEKLKARKSFAEEFEHLSQLTLEWANLLMRTKCSSVLGTSNEPHYASCDKNVISFSWRLSGPLLLGLKFGFDFNSLSMFCSALTKTLYSYTLDVDRPFLISIHINHFGLKRAAGLVGAPSPCKPMNM